ncbi:MAG: FtsX-like permease family protein [Candidatus Hodarchaeales archaeon]
MLKSVKFALRMTLTRMRRLIGQTVAMILGIAVIIAILFAMIVGTNVIRVNMMSSAFASITTDINIQFITGNSNSSALEDIASGITDNNNVDAVITKLFPNKEVFSENMSLKSGSSIGGLGGNSSITGLFGLASADLSSLMTKIHQLTNGQVSEQIDLNPGEIIVSTTTASELDVSTGDTCFFDLFDNTNQPIKNYSVRVAGIWNLTSSEEAFNEITGIPSRALAGEQITDFIILDKQTYLNLIKSFYTDINNDTILSNGILSISINHPSIIDRTNLTKIADRYNQVVDDIFSIIEALKPPESTILWESELGEEIAAINKQLSGSSLLFTLLGTALIVLLTGFYFILVQMKIDRSKHYFGMTLLRGSTITGVCQAFLLEGVFLGFIAGLTGAFLALTLLISFTLIILPATASESIIQFLDLTSFLPLITGSTGIGLILGIAGHSLITLQLDGMTVKTLLLRSIETESPVERNQKGKWQYFFTISLITVIAWSVWKFLYQFDTGGLWTIFLMIGDTVISFSVLLLPVFLMAGLAGFVTSKKSVIERIFTPLIGLILGNLTSIFFKGFWRKSRQIKRMTFVIASITVIAVSSAVIIDTREVIARRSITNEIGTDIQISGNYQLLESLEVDFQEFLNENARLIASSSQYSVYQGSFFAGYEGTGFCRVIAIDSMTDFVNTIYPGIYSARIQMELLDLMALIVGNNVIAPLAFHESYDWNIGDVRKLSLYSIATSSTVAFQVAGFYQHFPVFAVTEKTKENVLICSTTYLTSSLNLSNNVNTNLLIRLNPDLPTQTKKQFFQLIKSTFHAFEITILEDEVEEYQLSIGGRLNIIFDIIFVLAVLFSAFGIIWFIYAMFQDEKRELSVYQSRGMNRSTIVKIITLRVLVVELVGITTGLSVSIITVIFYADLLLPQLAVYSYSIPVTLLIKTMALLVLMAIIHSIALIITSLNWTRSDILTNLHFRV